MDDYMIIIIDEEGDIEFFGEEREYRFHIEALRDYFYTVDYNLAESVNADYLRKNEDIIYYLNRKGKIIFLNSLGYGICFVPKTINIKQSEALKSLLDSLKDKAIYIEYNLRKKDDKIVMDDFFNYKMDGVKKVGKSI